MKTLNHQNHLPHFLSNPNHLLLPRPMEVKRRTAKTLVKKLSSISDQTQAEAICELRLLSKRDMDSRLCIAEAGAIPYLTEALYSSNPNTQENAVTTLLNLSIFPENRERLMSTRGFLDAILHALRKGETTAAVQNAAATIYSLTVVEIYRPIIGDKPEIVSALLDTIRLGSPRSMKDSLKALFGIALYPLNRAKLVELGIVPVLFSLILNAGHVGLLEDSTAVIAQVAGCYESVDAFRKVSGLEVLVDLLDTGTGRARENAVSGLLNLAQSGGESVVEDIIDTGTAMGAVTELISKGSSRGKSKASALLMLLVRDGRSQRRFHSGSVNSESDL